MQVGPVWGSRVVFSCWNNLVSIGIYRPESSVALPPSSIHASFFTSCKLRTHRNLYLRQPMTQLLLRVKQYLYSLDVYIYVERERVSGSCGSAIFLLLLMLCLII